MIPLSRLFPCNKLTLLSENGPDLADDQGKEKAPRVVPECEMTVQPKHKRSDKDGNETPHPHRRCRRGAEVGTKYCEEHSTYYHFQKTSISSVETR